MGGPESKMNLTSSKGPKRIGICHHEQGGAFPSKITFFFVENMFFNVEDSSSEDLFYAHFNKDSLCTGNDINPKRFMKAFCRAIKEPRRL